MQPTRQTGFRLQMLHAAMPASMLAHLVVNCIVLAVLLQFFPAAEVWLWALLTPAVCAVRYAIYMALQKQPAGRRDDRQWRIWLLVTQTIAVLPMGVALFWFSSFAAFDATIFIVVCMGLIASAASFTSSCWLTGYYALALPLIVLPLVKLLYLGGPVALGLAGMCGVMLAFSAAFTRSQSRHIGESIDLRFEKEDLVQRLEAEKDTAVAARQAAEEAGRSKNRFFAAASHDLRQPLHALTLLAGALRYEASGTPHALRVEQVIASADSLNMLFNDLLSLSRLEGGDLNVEPQPLRLAKLLAHVAQDLGPMAEQRHLRFVVLPTPAIVHADPLILTRLLNNLIANAIAYTHRGGVLVGARVRRRPGGDVVHLQVWDTGVGIPPAEHKRVFEEFYQLHNPERDQAKGLGLGLATVQRLAQACGWPLELRSAPGRGSCFSVTLPLEKTDALEFLSPLPKGMQTGHGEPAHAVGNGSGDAPEISEDLLYGCRVLLVDDQPEIRHAMQILLFQWHCDARIAANAAEALALVAREQAQPGGGWTPELVVSDYWLPGPLSGIDTVQDVRRAVGRQVAAVLISGDTTPEQAQLAAQHDLMLLRKPVQSSVLRGKMVQALLRRP